MLVGAVVAFVVLRSEVRYLGVMVSDQAAGRLALAASIALNKDTIEDVRRMNVEMRARMDTIDAVHKLYRDEHSIVVRDFETRLRQLERRPSNENQGNADRHRNPSE